METLRSGQAAKPGPNKNSPEEKEAEGNDLDDKIDTESRQDPMTPKDLNSSRS